MILSNLASDGYALFVIVAVMFCGGSAVAYLIKRSFAFSLPIFSLAFMLLLFLASFAGNLNVAFYLGLAVVAALSLLTIYGLFMASDRERYRKNIFNYGLLAFALLALFCFVMNYSREVFYDDDLHYWARSVYEMLKLGDLVVRHPGSVLIGISKPPTTSLFVYFFTRLARSPFDFPLFVTMQLLMFSFLLPLFDSIRKEATKRAQWFRFFALLVLLPVLFVALTFRNYASIYSLLIIDLLISFEVGFGLFCILDKRLSTRLRVWILTLLCTVLAVQKETGVMMIVLLLLATALAGWIGSREDFDKDAHKDSLTRRRWLASTAIQMATMSCCAAVSYVMWYLVSR
jgi:hypothetical protein